MPKAVYADNIAHLARIVPAQDNHSVKWPVWARILVIVGLSALLWAGIISGAFVLVG